MTWLISLPAPLAALFCRAIGVAMCATLLGCEASPPEALTVAAAPEQLEWMICPQGVFFNFTDKIISSWYLYSVEGDQVGEKLGGSFGRTNERPEPGQHSESTGTRCVDLPRRWDEGDTYILRWQENNYHPNEPIVRGGNWWPRWYRATLKMPPYSAKAQGLGVFLFEEHKACLYLPSKHPATACVDADLQPLPDSFYVAQGALDEEMNASERVYWESQDMERMERERKAARVKEWVEEKYGKEARGVVHQLMLVENQEWEIENRPTDSESFAKNRIITLAKMRKNLKEAESQYGRSAKSLINANSVQEGNPEAIKEKK